MVPWFRALRRFKYRFVLVKRHQSLFGLDCNGQPGLDARVRLSELDTEFIWTFDAGRVRQKFCTQKRRLIALTIDNKFPIFRVPRGSQQVWRDSHLAHANNFAVFETRKLVHHHVIVRYFRCARKWFELTLYVFRCFPCLFIGRERRVHLVLVHPPRSRRHPIGPISVKEKAPNKEINGPHTSMFKLANNRRNKFY